MTCQFDPCQAFFLFRVCSLAFFFFFFPRDRVSLCWPGCPGTHSVDQPGPELRNLPASASQVLGLKACTTTPGFRRPFGAAWPIVSILPVGAARQPQRTSKTSALQAGVGFTPIAVAPRAVSENDVTDRQHLVLAGGLVLAQLHTIPQCICNAIAPYRRGNGSVAKLSVSAKVTCPKKYPAWRDVRAHLWLLYAALSPYGWLWSSAKIPFPWREGKLGLCACWPFINRNFKHISFEMGSHIAQVSTQLQRQTPNAYSSCLYLLSAGISGMWHHAWILCCWFCKEESTQAFALFNTLNHQSYYY
jgi:hypothetical protein